MAFPSIDALAAKEPLFTVGEGSEAIRKSHSAKAKNREASKRATAGRWKKYLRQEAIVKYAGKEKPPLAKYFSEDPFQRKKSCRAKRRAARTMARDCM
jgi:hypothetical protein